MSWSHYATYGSPEAAKRDVAALKEPTPEANYGTPAVAKKMILDAIDACGIVPATDPAAYLVGVKVEASGHSPQGNFAVKVEPIVIKL